MKSVYNVLNDVKVDPVDYEEAAMTELEKASAKRRFHKTFSAVNKRKSLYRWTAVAACAVFTVCISQTAYAQSIINGIIKQINLGHNSVIQMDPKQKPSSSPYLIKNGVLYDAKGNKVGTVTGEKETDVDSNTIKETDWSKAVSQLNFKPLNPKALPDGYSFDSAGLFKNEDGSASGDYVTFQYKNATNKILVNERRITSETTVTYATDGAVEKVNVNGHDAAFTDGHSVQWEADGVGISVTAKSFTRQQLINFADSFS